MSCFISSGESVESPDAVSAAGVSEAPPAVIPSQGDLLGDLLNLDLTPPTTTGPPPPSSGMQMGAVDLLGGGLDSLVGRHKTVLVKLVLHSVFEFSNRLSVNGP